jgi:hypothetical protein
MKTLARISLGVFLALTTIVPMSAANATCSVEIYANRAIFSGTAAFIYGTTGSLSTFSYFGSTTNFTMASLFFAAAAQRSHVLVTGSIASCPTAGVIRNIGVISNASISP